MHLYDRNGIWWTKIYVGGKPKYRSLRIPVGGPKNRREATRRALDMETLLQAGPDAGSLTWRAAVQQHLEATRVRDRHSEESRRTRVHKLDLFIEAVGETALVPESVDQAKAILADYFEARGRSLAASTVHGDQRYLHRLCRWMRKTALIRWPDNPAAMEWHELAVPERGDPVIYPEEDDLRLREAIRPTDCWRIYSLMRWAGLRTGEALRFRLADVDRADNVIRVGGTKTHQDRRVPIAADLARELPGLSFGPWTRDSMLKAWAGVVAAAGLPARFNETYTLRRTCISRALQVGLPAAIAARIFGHSVATMMRYYARLEVKDAGRYLV
jgi:integrase